MNNTVLVLCTHFVDEAIISEYRKMQNTPNVDVILAIDNTNFKHDITEKGRVQDITFFGIKVQCFFFDDKLHEELELPYFTFHGIDNFSKVMWHNGDYRFYYVKKYFPNYLYYWMFDYDVFCNANTYAVFLDKFNKNESDLIVCGFRREKKEGAWYWTHGLDWIYKESEIYGSFFPVVRLSANAINFLYQRRLEHKKIFEVSVDQEKRWFNCELFVPTELMNNGFSCENLAGEKYVTLEPIYLNDNRIFTVPDNHLYHPVKSTINEISKLNNIILNLRKQNQDLLLLYKKVFLTQLIERLLATTLVNIKNFGLKFEENFNYAFIPISEDFDLCYEIHFSNNAIHMLLNFQGKYINEYYDKIKKELEKQELLQHFSLYKSTRGGGIGIGLTITKFDNISLAVSAMNFLIDNTYHILNDINN